MAGPGGGRAAAVLAVDQGTSATKAAVVSADGRVLSRARVTVRTRTGAGGAAEQDPEALWRSVLGAGRAALAACGTAVAAVGLAHQGETILAWDRRSGRPLGPAISWQDRRAAAACGRLRRHAGSLQAITGLPLDPYFAAPRMVWLRERIAQRAPDGAAVAVTTSDVWLRHRLTGGFATDAATASRTLLLDLDRGAWSESACRIFGVEPLGLPAIGPSAGRLGMTQAFGGALPLTAAIVDQQAALHGEGCLLPAEAKCTLGTGAFLLVTTGPRPVRSRGGLAASVAWRLGGTTTHCLDGQLYTAGAALDWLRRLGPGTRPRGLDPALRRAADAGTRPRFVPALAGLAAPCWLPTARAALTGLTLATTRDDLIAAVVDGVAASVADLVALAAVDTGRRLARLRVDGGLVRSAAVVQSLADWVQLPVEVFPGGDATLMGVAALARHGMGDPAGAAQLATGWRPALVAQPAIDPDRAAAALAGWRAARDAVAQLAAAP